MPISETILKCWNILKEDDCRVDVNYIEAADNLIINFITELEYAIYIQEGDKFFKFYEPMVEGIMSMSTLLLYKDTNRLNIFCPEVIEKRDAIILVQKYFTANSIKILKSNYKLRLEAKDLLEGFLWGC
ncbi:MAG: hypothetical protein ABSA84_06320 [Gammaproteobacteria bacterium]